MTYIGMDVSKDHLDIAATGGATWREANTPRGVAALLARLGEIAPVLIVIEPTGGFERPAIAALASVGMAVARVNPRKVRDFARATGQIAKTDPIDARLLARYGQLLQPAPTAPPVPADDALVALVARRRQLVGMVTAEGNRLAQADAVSADSLHRHLAWLRIEIATLTRAIARAVADSPTWAKRAALLRTVPGVGPLLAATLLAELPELGRVSRGDIAGLAGLAPYNVESGKQRGRRRIVGGRANLRAALYMPTLTATKRNPTIAAYYDRLRARGKCHKVAVTACMRKLLVILNAMVKANAPWDGTMVLEATITP